MPTGSPEKSTQTFNLYDCPKASFRTSFPEVRQQRSYSIGERELYGIRSRAGLFIPEVAADSSLGLNTASGELPDVSLTRPPSQGSLVTIFSLWSTFVGTSALTIPWAVARGGLVLSLAMIVLIAAFAYYPLRMIFRCAQYVEVSTNVHVYKFQEICNQILGPRIALFSLGVSLFNLLGDLICYWLMLTTFLYEIGLFGETGSRDRSIQENITTLASSVDVAQNDAGSFWSETISVPLYLVLLMLPVMSFRYPTFFTKCGSLGSVAIVFLIIFAIVKTAVNGIQIEPDVAPDFTLASQQVPATCGVLFFGFLIHNVIVSVTAYHNQPRKRARDTGIAVVLAAVTYAVLGILLYLSHPGPKEGIYDNFLKNFPNNDALSFVARILLFFQMITMFPLLAFVFRAQLFYGWARRIDLGMHYIVLLNVALLGVCLAFASLYPRIGHILRFGGAFCGLVYICLLPGIMDAVIAYRSGHRVIWKIFVIFVYVSLGLANLIAQFFILF
ncbi:neutral amino acid transporter 9-like isoform X2 [Paramacrobiotus metropolitanus]|uniref:neutral amino acid transporter 9-like isoform X2 n=1 Tax=Paramacrobiotus metropolitanus TaxID=2943436 RepID=UPI0024456FDF|nr:neutral amino acid transporter 9-like isoform X2 [Paramacrobiotus metropolitanus]